MATLLGEHGQVLIIEPTKAGAQRTATALAKEIEEDDPECAALVALASTRLGAAHPLVDVLRRGVGFHHAALPGDIQAELEDGIRKGPLRYLVATTTLVEGINFPVRSVLIGDRGYPSADGYVTTLDAAQSRIRDAEAHARRGDYVEALALLSEALDDLLDDYANRKPTRYNKSAFDFAPDTPLGDFDLNEIKEINDKVGQQIEALTNAAYEVNLALRVIAVGLDYRRYARFDMLVPAVFSSGGERHVRPVPGLLVGEEEYQFCKLFVIESALHLAELDFDLDLGRNCAGTPGEHRPAPPPG
jgi:tetratricopeptide (TPR) repeat protein